MRGVNGQGLLDCGVYSGQSGVKGAKQRGIHSRLARGLFGIAWLLMSCGTAAVGEDGPAIGKAIAAESAARITRDIQFFASDAMEGRGVETAGLMHAGDWIAGRLQSLGWKTDLFDGTPYQAFSIEGPLTMGASESNRMTLIDPQGTSVPWKLSEDFTPVSLGSNATVTAPLVFVGYGISADEGEGKLQYDDYAGIDVQGKIVVILRKEPRPNDPESPFEGTQSSRYAFFATKVTNAIAHGAAGVILVNDKATSEESNDALLSIDGAGRAPRAGNKIPVLFARRAAVDPIVQSATGKTLADLEVEIDSDLKPRSIELGGWKADGQAELVEASIQVRNVIAMLPGEGELADEYVVVGAHYDHVGMGGPGSLAPGTIAVHNGADDNGSGTVTLMEVARRLAIQPPSPRRTLVVMAFSAEERGLLGSRHYCRNPRFPLEKTVAMVNMDMVGRLDSDRLTIFGTGSAKQFDAWVDALNAKHQFDLDKVPAGLGPSDHASFFEVGVPVFHFFTGLHNDYHRPSDDPDKINVDGMVRIADMMTELTLQLATTSEKPEFVKVAGRANPQAVVPRRPRMQIQLKTDAEGVVIESVEAGGAAEKAGLMPGDKLLELADKELPGPDALMEALSSHKVGETVTVEYQRGEEKKMTDVTLVK
jgi:Zn-dependent M28 family amino/carboxypeptidase